MELVGPRSRDHVDLPADRAAILRRQDALDDLHFGDRLDAQDLDLVLAAVVAEAAVFRVGLGAAAVHRDGAAAVADAVHAERPATADCLVARTDTRAQQDDVLQIPPGHRNLGHLGANGLHLRGRSRLHERRRFGDRDRLFERAHFEYVGLPHFLARAELQALAAICLEPRELNPDRIRSGRKRGESELAACIRYRFSHQIGPAVSDDDADTGQDRSGAVVDDAVQGGFKDLSTGVRCHHEDADGSDREGLSQQSHRDLQSRNVLYRNAYEVSIE